LGNIAGVAVAVAVGGPGATFWIIFAGLMGMTLKFVECTLGVKYREIDDAGIVYGGPMYYLSKGFANMRMDIGGKESHFTRIGKVLAVVFAVSCVLGSLGGGNMLQINQSFKQFNDITAKEIVLADVGTLVGSEVFPRAKQTQKYVLTSLAGDQATLTEETSGEVSTVSTAALATSYVTKPFDNYGWAVGLLMAGMVGVVIIGGIKSIARVTDKLVPLMCGLYVIAGLFVIIVNIQHLPDALWTILTSAFGYKQLGGGMLGVLIIGFKRAAFSNEAGIGSASIAHSAVKTNYPASEGLVSLLEPFIDTVVICTMTALVIVISGKYVGAGLEDGISTTSNAFATVIVWFPYVLFVAVVMFAFSTMISWSYYGMQAWAYLFGRSKTAEYIYKGTFCMMVVVGAAMDLKPVMAFSDTSIFMMLFPNIIGLIFLAPVVRHELAVYLSKIKEMKAAAGK
jgi:alanine or glycine:cation symporter, AGCS family